MEPLGDLQDLYVSAQPKAESLTALYIPSWTNSLQTLYGLQSKLPVSPSRTLAILPCIFPYITPLRNADCNSYYKEHSSYVQVKASTQPMFRSRDIETCGKPVSRLYLRPVTVGLPGCTLGGHTIGIHYDPNVIFVILYSHHYWVGDPPKVYIVYARKTEGRV